MSEISDALREAVARRAGWRCEYCRIPTRGQIAVFPIDHIHPRILGGITELNNLAFACPHCNACKWKHVVGIDAETNREVALFNPRIDVWEEHFEWAEDRSWVLVGKSACGRATVARLQVNHPEVVRTRQLLAELGLLTEVI